MIANNPMRPVCEYATDSQYKEAPNQEQLSCGVIPLDSLPAEWWNYLWGNANQQINNGVVALNNVIAEIINVMSAAGISPVSECTDQLKSSIQLLAQCIGTSTKAGAVKSSSTCGQVSISSTGIMTANGLGNASNLTTTNKGNVVAAINELKSQHEQQITDLESQVQGLQDSTVTGVKLNSSGTVINPTSGIIDLGLGSVAKCDASCFLVPSSLTAYAKQNGYFTGATDSWVCCANNASCLGGTAAACYALLTSTVANASKLGGTEAACYALKSGTVACATTATNASCLGGCLAACYALKTGTVACATNAGTATNASCLGGCLAACYALKSGTVSCATNATNATNADCLGGTAARDYALKTDTAPSATTATTATCLGGVLAACYALKTDTVANATCLGGCLAACYALKTDTIANATNASCLGGCLAACYALKTGTVACATNAGNSSCLGGCLAACYALKTGTVACATNAGSAGSATYATNLGTSSAYHTYTSLNNAINGKAPTDHSSVSAMYGSATPLRYGHVKIAPRMHDETAIINTSISCSLSLISTSTISLQDISGDRSKTKIQIEVQNTSSPSLGILDTKGLRIRNDTPYILYPLGYTVHLCCPYGGSIDINPELCNPLYAVAPGDFLCLASLTNKGSQKSKLCLDFSYVIDKYVTWVT